MARHSMTAVDDITDVGLIRGPASLPRRPEPGQRSSVAVKALATPRSRRAASRSRSVVRRVQARCPNGRVSRAFGEFPIPGGEFSQLFWVLHQPAPKDQVVRINRRSAVKLIYVNRHGVDRMSYRLSRGKIGRQAQRLGGAEHSPAELLDSAHFELPNPLARDLKAPTQFFERQRVVPQTPL